MYINEFGDTLTADGELFDKGGKILKLYIVMMNGEYIQTVNGEKQAKAFINKKRGTKTTFTVTKDN